MYFEYREKILSPKSERRKTAKLIALKATTIQLCEQHISLSSFTTIIMNLFLMKTK
jgi:hypothetical protein